MTRTTIVAVLAALAALLATVTASATTTQRLRADLHDNLACPAGFDLCGKGVLHGFGTFTTTLRFTGFGPGPGNCASVTGDRVLTLDSDGSTLDLSLEGILCPQGNPHAPGTGSGTFAVVSGTGRFSGATGSGRLLLQATGAPGLTDSAHYEGTLTLPQLDGRGAGIELRVVGSRDGLPEPLARSRRRLAAGTGISHALAEVERLSRLVEALLSLARADAATGVTETVDVDAVLACSATTDARLSVLASFEGTGYARGAGVEPAARRAVAPPSLGVHAASIRGIPGTPRPGRRLCAPGHPELGTPDYPSPMVMVA